MKIIFAQGNPGEQFTSSRHNIGFFIVDAFGKKIDAPFSNKSKFQADIAETSLNGEKILLVKPRTFYNDTGIAARLLLDFYKVDPASDLLVIHDELALPFGTLKTRFDGSDAGNNGIKSLNSHLGHRYARIRVGIYNPLRDLMDDADFVLGKFSAEEKKSLPLIATHSHQFIDEFLAGTFTSTRISLPL